MTAHNAYFSAKDCRLADFEALLDRVLSPDKVPAAGRIAENIPIYDVAGCDLETIRAEWAWVLSEGPGVLVLKGAMPDLDVVDAATDAFHAIIAEESAQGGTGSDHFAASGANARIWNALQKLCMHDPALFARYFASPALAAVAEAWLGPNYQMTAQINLVRPGGAAQTAHRDYHLGFQTQDQAARYPAHAHRLTAALTLQGAVAHCDMPVESGPTKLLPYSQLYETGYLAFHEADFREAFEARHVQLPLAKGDAVFFNPALFHAAGENRSEDIQRMANLLQVSSAFGRAMESVDRTAMCRVLYPALRDLSETGALRPDQVNAAIGAAAEGYAFPTNLDTDPPEGGLAPEAQAQMTRRALTERWSSATYDAALKALDQRRKA